MDSGRKPGREVFSMKIDGIIVHVRFSMNESDQVKDKIRNILTNAYEERSLQCFKEVAHS